MHYSADDVHVIINVYHHFYYFINSFIIEFILLINSWKSIHIFIYISVQIEQKNQTVNLTLAFFVTTSHQFVSILTSICTYLSFYNTKPYLPNLRHLISLLHYRLHVSLLLDFNINLYLFTRL